MASSTWSSSWKLVTSIISVLWGDGVLGCLSEFCWLNTPLIDMHRESYLWFSMVIYIFVGTNILLDQDIKLQEPKGLPVENETREDLEGHFLNATIEPISLPCLMPNVCCFLPLTAHALRILLQPDGTNIEKDGWILVLCLWLVQAPRGSAPLFELFFSWSVCFIFS